MRVTQTASPGATGSPSSAGGGGGGGGGGPSMILCASFNQDASCLSVGFPSSQDPHGTGTSGFAVFNCDPFGRFYSSSSSPSSEGASFSVVEMLFTTSLVALVGAGHTPQQSPRRLQIVNTKRDSTICELTFVSSILAVKLNRRRLVVVLEEHIYIYDISNMKLLHTIDTSPNPHALCALSPSSDNCYLAYPPSTSGSSSGDLLIFDAVNLQAVNIIQAHKSPLSCIAFSSDGTLIATSSDKGTVIRVFSVPTGSKLFQLRRGSYNASIYSLAFDAANRFVCVSSDTDTVHVFKLMSEAERRALDARRRSLEVAGGVPMGGDGAGSQSSVKKALGGFLGQVAHATSAVSGFLPGALTEMWEPQRDFAFAKLPQGCKGFQNMCALVGGAGVAGGGVSARASPGFGTIDFDNAGLEGSGSSVPLQLVVVSASGFFYGYTLDGEMGGECVLVKEHSLLDD